MKLVYWVAPCLDDSSAYNIRAKTRKEAKRLLAQHLSGGGGVTYGEVQRHEVHYKDGFDLVDQALGDGNLYEPDY